MSSKRNPYLQAPQESWMQKITSCFNVKAKVNNLTKTLSSISEHLYTCCEKQTWAITFGILFLAALYNQYKLGQDQGAQIYVRWAAAISLLLCVIAYFMEEQQKKATKTKKMEKEVNHEKKRHSEMFVTRDWHAKLNEADKIYRQLEESSRFARGVIEESKQAQTHNSQNRVQQHKNQITFGAREKLQTERNNPFKNLAPEPQEEMDWQPIVSSESVRFTETQGNQRYFRKQEQFELKYFREYDSTYHNKAEQFLVSELNCRFENIREFVERTKEHVLGRLFRDLLCSYENLLHQVVHLINQKCHSSIKPHCENLSDLTQNEYRIYGSQDRQANEIDIYDLIRKVVKDDLQSLPEIRNLGKDDREKLDKDCKELAQIFRVFDATSLISSAYVHKEHFVIKRLDQMAENPQHEFNSCASGPSIYDSLAKSERSTSVFNGRGWMVGAHLPSDPEIVTAVFCAILDDSTDFSKRHLFSKELTNLEVEKNLEAHNIALINKQPSEYYRPHYELVADRKVHELPTGDNNVWFGITMLYASIFKMSCLKPHNMRHLSLKHLQSQYGSYDVTSACEVIFQEYFYENLKEMRLFS